MKQGQIIAFEGVDGAGKSTVIRRVARALEERGHTVYLPRTGKEHASRPTRMIRRLTRDPRNLDLSARSELALYCAREAQILEECVRPAVARGETVLLDRSLLTPVVLGAWGRGLAREECEAMAALAAGGTTADVTLIFDVHPRTSRLRKRVEKVRTKTLGDGGRKGLGGSGLKERVRDGYSALAADRGYPLFHVERISPDVLAERVLSVLFDGADVADLEDPSDALPSWMVAPGSDLFTAMSQQRPEAALFLGNGLRLARPLRAQYLDQDPALVAWSLDEEDPLREAAASKEPEYALRGWTHRPCAGAEDLRLRLLPTAPDAALRSLKYLESKELDELRARYADVVPGAVAASLAGREDAAAYELRKRVWKGSEIADCVSSLAHCGSADAWRLRAKLAEKDPAETVAGLRGLEGPQVDELIARCTSGAPRAALRALGGRNDGFAHEVRQTLITTGREVIDSIRGLNDAPSWKLREQWLDRWPSTVVHSLSGLEDTPRAQEMVAQCVRVAPGDLHTLRRVQGLRERKDRPAWARNDGGDSEGD